MAAVPPVNELRHEDQNRRNFADRGGGVHLAPAGPPERTCRRGREAPGQSGGGVIVVTTERFAQGMTGRQYIEQMSMNKERFLAALDSITIAAKDTEVLHRLAGTRKILVITEDWCGTSIASFPFVVKLVEGMPDIEMRVFLRDENPDLMDQFLKNGVYRSIPVFAFFDEHMNELARFIERRPA
jgi:Thioredoxin